MTSSEPATLRLVLFTLRLASTARAGIYTSPVP